MDDENMTIISNTDAKEQLEKTHFKCQTSNKYIPRSFIGNGQCNCEDTKIGWCED
jgi:hypothetical protein